MEDQWPRALLRAALLDAGYDAVGARSVPEAFALPVSDPERGPVRLVIVDRPVLGHEESAVAQLLRMHGNPIALLLAPAGEGTPAGSWHRVIHRPVSIGGIISVVQTLLPLAATASGDIE
jgi:hypothetical protein